MPYLQLLEQDRWWRTATGSLVKLRKMSLPHQLNTLSLLVRNAPVSAFELQQKAWSNSMSVEAVHGGDVPDGVFSAMGQWEAEAEDAVRQPQAWMRARPLFRKLVRLVAEQLGVVPEDLGLEQEEVDDRMTKATRKIWVEAR
jgi:hypothetical protein